MLTLIDVDAEFVRIVDELTRRKFLIGTAGTAALLGLEACGSRHASPSKSGAPSASGTTIDTAYGPVITPPNPSRVVCIDTYTVSALLDVGYTPIGVGDGGADFMLPKYRNTYDAMAKVASADQQVDVEAVAALHPDLILGVDYAYISDLRSKLSVIAPTAIFTWNSSGDWVAMAASAAKVVGRTKPETDLESRYHQEAAGIRKTYADTLSRVRFDLVTAGGGQAYIWLPASGVGAVLADAGVKFAAASTGAAINATSDDLAVGFKAISYELLDTLHDADAIITVAGSGGKPDPDSADMMKQPSFSRLPAAQEDHVTAFSNFFPFSYGQALAALGELKTVLDSLKGSSR